MSRFGKNPAMVVRNGNREGSPLSSLERDAKLSGVRVEMETRIGNPDERSADIWHPTFDFLTETTPMPVHEGSSDISGHEPDSTSDSGF